MSFHHVCVQVPIFRWRGFAMRMSWQRGNFLWGPISPVDRSQVQLAMFTIFILFYFVKDEKKYQNENVAMIELVYRLPGRVQNAAPRVAHESHPHWSCYFCAIPLSSVCSCLCEIQPSFQPVLSSAISDSGTHTVALWETMQHCIVSHSMKVRVPLFTALHSTHSVPWHCWWGRVSWW